MSMYIERKNYQELRIRLSLELETESVDRLSWNGKRLDEFIVTDHEAEAIGVPTPSFGEGVKFEPDLFVSLAYGGAVSSLMSLAEGPKAAGSEMPEQFGEFAEWLLRQAWDEEKLQWTDRWSIFACGDHFHLEHTFSNGDVEHDLFKYGTSVYSTLSDEERAAADEVAGMIVDEIDESNMWENVFRGMASGDLGFLDLDNESGKWN